VKNLGELDSAFPNSGAEEAEVPPGGETFRRKKMQVAS
jgi:hypothetical protein